MDMINHSDFADIECLSRKWHQLPYWCDFFLKLGSWITMQEAFQSLTIAVAVPDRSFAAVFTSLGIVSGLNQRKTSSSSTHFEFLCALEKGTPLIYFEKDKRLDKIIRKKAVFLGTDIHPILNTAVVKIQLENAKNGGLTEWILPQKATSVCLADRGEVDLPMVQHGRELRMSSNFVARFLDGTDPSRFLANSRCDCIIVGKVNQLTEELTDTRLRVPYGINFHEGTIQDVTRARRLITSLGFHSEIIADSHMPNELSKETAPCAVFDGAKAYLNLNESVGAPCRIIILDKTERYYQDAVVQINEKFLTSGDGRCLTEAPAGLNIPRAVSVMIMEG